MLVHSVVFSSASADMGVLVSRTLCLVIAQERAKLEKIAAGEGAEGGSGGAGGADAGEGAESWFSLADGDDTFVWHITILGPKTYGALQSPRAGFRSRNCVADGVTLLSKLCAVRSCSREP